ncbi:MAG: hypothetical protein UX28_C0001G0122 [Candidatus Pacebacteria bacterium GW2011_GWA1_46_10]|nr:MAG: hypothetical protein UX28_C0001G0122 [Candidatus Pacebacteria bacterium GW2011_GWA1_46_10]HCR81313.1 hypothetical protein [Candidatus Paceibacterota bacterium]
MSTDPERKIDLEEESSETETSVVVDRFPPELIEELGILLEPMWQEGYLAPEGNPLISLARRYGVPTLQWALHEVRSKYLRFFPQEFDSDEAKEARIVTHNQAIRQLYDWGKEIGITF